MRLLALGSASSALLTFLTCVALRAAEPVVAIAAVAALTVLLTWYAGLHTADDVPALGTVSPTALAALAAAGRVPWGTVLPTVAAHAVGAVLGGLAGLGLGDRLGDPLVFDADDLVVAGVGAAVVGLIAAWATLAIDGGGSEALAAVPVAVAGALPLGLVGSFSSSVILGLAVGDLVPWTPALVAAGASLVAAAIGGSAIGLVVPSVDDPATEDPTTDEQE